MIADFVLIVDDDPESLHILEDLFQKNLNCTVAVARSVKEAESLLKIKTFRVVVSDLEMPERKGSELVHALQNLPITIPLIFFTASDQSRTFWDSLDYPCHVVRKPDFRELLKVVTCFFPSRFETCL